MSKRVTVRLSDAEVRLLEEATSYLGDSSSEVLRKALRFLCLSEKPQVEHVYCVRDPSLEKLLAEFARQGNNLNQIARHLNAGGVPEEVVDSLRKVLSMIAHSHESMDSIVSMTEANMLAVVPR
ncbi:plasmid mobilization relaxosome protein MobC [Corynebacterium sp. KPL2850]|uniref:plasmid mobilization relaxosome protein MobC n=1 Tax=Corynebacterium sp. KPL2850 TaxID=3158318 RepID=UPI0032ED7CB0